MAVNEQRGFPPREDDTPNPRRQDEVGAGQAPRLPDAARLKRAIERGWHRQGIGGGHLPKRALLSMVNRIGLGGIVKFCGSPVRA